MNVPVTLPRTRLQGDRELLLEVAQVVICDGGGDGGGGGGGEVVVVYVAEAHRNHLFVCMHVCMHVCLYACMYVRTSVRVHSYN